MIRTLPAMPWVGLPAIRSPFLAGLGRLAGCARIAALAGVAALGSLAALAGPVAAQEPPRARDLGVPFDGATGPLNAITDVTGVEVGHTTLISGEGALVVGEGPVRTGVTAILPRGRGSYDPVFAAWFPLNGNGEMTGTTCPTTDCARFSRGTADLAASLPADPAR